jgi:hypothetical protein
MMTLPDGVTLLATVCNTTPNAVPYALWMARGCEQYLIDLSDVLGQPGDGGLTGLTCLNGYIYLAVQSNNPRLLTLDRKLTPVGVITSPEFKDIHSIHGVRDGLIVCSTGAQSVVRVDVRDHSTTKLCEFDVNVHLNSATFDGANLLICCHYPGQVLPSAEGGGGGVIDATTRQVVLAGLTQPHSLEPDRQSFLVLDSDGHSLIRFDHTGIVQQQALTGFLRGMTTARGSLFVASSAGRVISRKNPAVPPGRQFWQNVGEPVTIHELDHATLEIKAKHVPLIAGFEVYELLALDDGSALTPAAERLVSPDLNAIARVYYEAAKRAIAQAHQQR